MDIEIQLIFPKIEHDGRRERSRGSEQNMIERFSFVRYTLVEEPYAVPLRRLATGAPRMDLRRVTADSR